MPTPRTVDTAAGRTADPAAFDALLTGARTARTWAATPVPEGLVAQVYDTVRWGPSAMNSTPLRLLELRSAEARERLAGTMAGGNADVVRAAPLSLVVAADPRWHEHLDALAPYLAHLREQFEADPAGSAEIARSNTWLQAGYLVLALRARGLDVGTMTGMDTAAVEADLLAGTGWLPLMVVNVGYPAEVDTTRPRAARLTAADVTRVL